MARAEIILHHRIVSPRRKPIGLVCWLLRLPGGNAGIFTAPSDPVTRMRLRRGRPASRSR